MKLGTLLNDENVILELDQEDSHGSITAMVDHLVSVDSLPLSLKDEMLSALFAREEQVSTGIGSGVAIPHAFSPSIDEAIVAFGRSTDGVDFDSMDNALVHFVILFLVPEEKRNTHLQTLAAVAKTFKTCGVRESLIDAQSAEDIISVLTSCNN